MATDMDRAKREVIASNDDYMPLTDDDETAWRIRKSATLEINGKCYVELNEVRSLVEAVVEAYY